MAKSISKILDESKKFLEKNGKANLNLKHAQAALAEAERVASEVSSLKSRLSEMIETRQASLGGLEQAIAKVKLEKRLKAKEAKVQAKLADLSAPQGGSK
jgi:hypothetical protein